jgi:uncharacterized protein (TIRG00374 family)
MTSHTKATSKNLTPALVFNAIVAALLLGLLSLNVSGHKWSRLETDTFQLINDLPGWLAPLLTTIMQLGSYLAVFALGGLLLLFRKVKLGIGILIAGNLAYWLAKAIKLLAGRGRPTQILKTVHLHDIISSGLGYPSGHTAVATAVGFMLVKFTPRRFHRYVWLGVIVVGIARIYVGAHWPIDVMGGFLVGWLAATITQIIIGGPDPESILARVREVMARHGLCFKSLQYTKSDARGSIPLIGETNDGQKLFIKLTSSEHRDADWLFKIYRRIVYQRIEDETPFITPKQKNEHEAYMSLRAERAGVRTPPLVMTAVDNNGNAYLVQKFVQGQTLDKIASRSQAQEALRDTWRQAALLHNADIAHRDLRGTNILIHEQSAYITDLGFAEENASDEQKARDNVELLVTSALLTDARTAVDIAKGQLGQPALIASLPYLQTSVLSRPLRHELKAHPDLLKSLRHEIEQLSDAPSATKLANVQRITWKNVFIVVLLGIGVYVLLPQIGQLHLALRALLHANPLWAAAALLASIITYLFSALVFRAAAPGAGPLWPILQLQVANSFANRLTPASIGSLALGIRFLQKRGKSTASASTAVGLTRLVGVPSALLLLPILFVYARHAPTHIAAVPKGITILLGALAILVAIGILLAIPKLRHKVRTAARQVIDSLHAVATLHHLVPLLLSALALTLSYGLCLYFALLAVHVHISFAHVLLVFIAGSTLGSAAPIPGGIGATEAALVSGLVLFGAPTEPAIAGVLIYRIASFWLPMLPGFLAYRNLTKTDHL